MKLISIDPGTTESAYTIYDSKTREVYAEIVDNEDLLAMLRDGVEVDCFAIERIQSYGMPVGESIFKTVFWSGRFVEAWVRNNDEKSWMGVDRSSVKMHLCKSMQANDSNIRKAVIEKFGPEEEAIGGKKCSVCGGNGVRGRGKNKATCVECEGSGWRYPPGPLRGVVRDMWSSTAIALTVVETKKDAHEKTG